MTDISQKLKSDIKVEDLKQENGILCYMNDYFISGDNQKYMKMYDWMSFFYDFGEKWIGRIKYGHAIDHLRTELMSRFLAQTYPNMVLFGTFQGQKCENSKAGKEQNDAQLDIRIPG